MALSVSVFKQIHERQYKVSSIDRTMIYNDKFSLALQGDYNLIKIIIVTV